MKAVKWMTAAAVLGLFLFPGSNLYAADKVVAGMGGGHALSHAGIYIAMEKGYFKAQGIEYVGRYFKSAGDTIGLLGMGQLDIATGAPSAGLINAVARGIQLRIVADKASLKKGTRFHGLVIRKDLVDSGRYKKLSDLKGLRIAVAARGVTPDYTLSVWAKMGGIKFSDIHLAILSPPNAVTALSNKSIDGAVVWEPLMSLIVDKGIGDLVERTEDTMPNLETAVIIYSQNFAQDRRDVAERFMIAYLQGNREYTDAFFKNNPEKRKEVIRILAKDSDVHDPALIAKLGRVWLDPNGEVNKDSIKKMQNFWFSEGLVKKMVNVDKLVDESFAREAVKKLGLYR